MNLYRMFTPEGNDYFITCSSKDIENLIDMIPSCEHIQVEDVIINENYSGYKEGETQ